jgi:5-hydroxyisourate hydrolase|uniref:hydroxyisourate hydrolase n=4 Tax=Clonostachys TaxID=110564 RepID=A0A8H7KAM9_BIOOC
MPRPRADQHSGDIPRSPANYLNLLSRHITPKMSNKDPITCHVLDTTAGRPAKGIRVRLEGPAPPPTPDSSLFSSHADGDVKRFESMTDDDGRIQAWLPYSSQTEAGEIPVYTLEDVLANVKGPSRWTLRFDTAGYFGEEHTFFPEATIVFRVEEGQHYHVPLLLSPYSYTTYRGS